MNKLYFLLSVAIIVQLLSSCNSKNKNTDDEMLKSVNELVGNSAELIEIEEMCRNEFDYSDIQIARLLTRIASEETEAYNIIGVFYSVKDFKYYSAEKNYKWWLKSSKKGDFEGSINLLNLHLTNEESKFYSPEKAYNLLKSVIKKQDKTGEANYRLGTLYFNGIGCDKSVTIAKKYFETAYKLGYEDAEEAIIVCENFNNKSEQESTHLSSNNKEKQNCVASATIEFKQNICSCSGDKSLSMTTTANSWVETTANYNYASASVVSYSNCIAGEYSFDFTFEEVPCIGSGVEKVHSYSGDIHIDGKYRNYVVTIGDDWGSVTIDIYGY